MGPRKQKNMSMIEDILRSEPEILAEFKRISDEMDLTEDGRAFKKQMGEVLNAARNLITEDSLSMKELTELLDKLRNINNGNP